MARTFAFSKECSISTKGLSAQKIGEELQKIHSKNPRGFGPRVVARSARPKSSLLHPIFEWNDGKAAELYREQQARLLINTVEVDYDGRQAPAYVSTRFVSQEDSSPHAAGGHYSPIETVMSDERLRHSLIEHVQRRLENLRDSYQDLREFANVWAEVSRVSRKSKKKTKAA